MSWCYRTAEVVAGTASARTAVWVLRRYNPSAAPASGPVAGENAGSAIEADAAAVAELAGAPMLHLYFDQASNVSNCEWTCRERAVGTRVGH